MQKARIGEVDCGVVEKVISVDALFTSRLSFDCLRAGAALDSRNSKLLSLTAVL